MPTRTRLTAAVPTVFALALSWTAHAQTPPCSLLSQDEVSKIVAAKVSAASPIAASGCSWTTATAPKITLTVSMQSEKMFAAAKSSTPPKTTKTPISGIGDEAVFTGIQNFSSLWVKKGAKYLLVRIYGVSVDDAETKLKAAAAGAVPKL
jgi:hypothetical protein